MCPALPGILAQIASLPIHIRCLQTHHTFPSSSESIWQCSSGRWMSETAAITSSPSNDVSRRENDFWALLTQVGWDSEILRWNTLLHICKPWSQSSAFCKPRCLWELRMHFLYIFFSNDPVENISTGQGKMAPSYVELYMKNIFSVQHGWKTVNKQTKH